MLAFFVAHALTFAALAVCLFAWWKGAAAERRAAYVVGAAWIGAYVGQIVLINIGAPYRLFPYFSLVVDGATAIGLLIIALRHSKLWLGGAVLIQAAALMMHALFLGGDGDRASAINYVTRINALGAALILLMLTAAVWAWRDRGSLRSASAAAAA